ncbi:MAG: MATE family efflux transporter [Cyanobacteria bacterium P01_E01_bin.48]
MSRILTEGKVGLQLVRLTLPMVGGVFAIVAFNLADTFFVGQLGTLPLAAVSFTFPVVLLLGSLAMGLGIGASSVISRAIGEGDRDRVCRFTTNSLLLALLVVFLFVCLGLLTIDPLFALLGATPEELPLIRDYMKIWYFGMVFLVVPMVGNSAIRAAGNTGTPSLIMTMAAGLNIALDPLLIFGWDGIPRLELQGSALATVIARAMTLVASLLVLHFKERLLSLRWPRLLEMLWCWKDIMQVGVPAAMVQIITPISIGVITALLATFGAEAVAAFGVASRVESLATIATMALSASIGPFVGQNWGAKAYVRVRRSLQLSLKFSIGWGLFVALLLLPGAPWIAGQFNPNPNVIAIATRYLWIVPISYGGAGIIQVASSAFNALGKPLPAVVMSIVRTGVLYIPLAYLGAQFIGIIGVFFAASISNLLVGIAAYVWNQQTCTAKIVATQASTLPIAN